MSRHLYLAHLYIVISGYLRTASDADDWIPITTLKLHLFHTEHIHIYKDNRISKWSLPNIFMTKYPLLNFWYLVKQISSWNSKKCPPTEEVEVNSSEDDAGGQASKWLTERTESVEIYIASLQSVYSQVPRIMLIIILITIITSQTVQRVKTIPEELH